MHVRARVNIRKYGSSFMTVFLASFWWPYLPYRITVHSSPARGCPSVPEVSSSWSIWGLQSSGELLLSRLCCRQTIPATYPWAPDFAQKKWQMPQLLRKKSNQLKLQTFCTDKFGCSCHHAWHSYSVFARFWTWSPSEICALELKSDLVPIVFELRRQKNMYKTWSWGSHSCSLLLGTRRSLPVICVIRQTWRT